MNSQWHLELFRSFSQNSSVFAGDVSNVFCGMAPVDLVHWSVEVHFLGFNLGLSLNEKHLALSSVFKGVGNSFSVSLGTNDFGGESLFGWEFQELIFPDVLRMVVVSEELSLVLDITSDEGGIGVDLPDLNLSRKIVLFWIGISVMVVLDGGGEEEVRSLWS